MNCICIENLNFYIQEKPILNNISIQIGAEKISSIIGGSGSGKTTLFKTILGIHTVNYKQEGKISIFGTDYKKYPKHKLQPIFQDPWAYLSPSMTLLEILQEPEIILHKKIRPSFQETLEQLLKDFSLDASLLNQRTMNLSGGEIQRISLIRALLCEPRILLMDEPLSAVDNKNRDDIIYYIKKLNQERKITIVFISHDIGVAKYLSDYMFIMQNGSVIEEGDPKIILEKPKTQYTQELIASENLNIRKVG